MDDVDWQVSVSGDLEWNVESGGLGKGFLQIKPSRVLAEVAAKRRILDEHPLSHPAAGRGNSGPWESQSAEYQAAYPVTSWGCQLCSADDQGAYWTHPDGPCVTLRALASVYASRPGFREEWAL